LAEVVKVVAKPLGLDRSGKNMKLPTHLDPVRGFDHRTDALLAVTRVRGYPWARHPASDNDQAEARSKNRRCQVLFQTRRLRPDSTPVRMERL